MTNPLTLAVVGHTNVGKTSLLRTLTRNRQFGEVSHRPSTTREVLGARLSVAGESILELFDTPGMEDAVALLEHLESLNQGGERLDGPARIERFLHSAEARQRFEQEAKVLRRLLSADAGLYVIDAREPVLAKYRDELTLLSFCGKPLLPVLNFTAAGSGRESQWLEVLARLGLHARLAFDSVTPPLDGEQRLYESLAILLEPFRPNLQRLINDQQQQRQARRLAGQQLIAELLIDIAACRRSVDNQAEAEQAAIRQLHDAVRQREQQCVQALLNLYAFNQNDANTGQLPLLDGRWGEDLFNPETMKQLGVRLSSGMAAGAAAGVGIDLMVGGITLGAAAVLGALAGGGTQTLRHYGKRLKARITGARELTVDDSILRLLALRQQQLLSALEARGHAAITPLLIEAAQQQQWQSGKLPEELDKARAHPEWSALEQRIYGDEERQRSVNTLAKSLS